MWSSNQYASMTKVKDSLLRSYWVVKIILAKIRFYNLVRTQLYNWTKGGPKLLEHNCRVTQRFIGLTKHHPIIYLIIAKLTNQTET